MALDDTELLLALVVIVVIGIALSAARKLDLARKRPWLYNLLFHGFRVDFSKPHLTVLLPATIMFVLNGLAAGTDERVVMLNPYLWLAVGVVIQPIVEEIMFRGWLLSGFLGAAERRNVWTVVGLLAAGVAVSTVGFVLYHMKGFPLFLVAQSVMYTALFLGFRRNIVPATVAHMANNLLVLLTVQGLLPVGYVLRLMAAGKLIY